MKAGFAPTSPPPSTTESLKNCHIIPNALCRTRDKRTYVGAQLLSHISDWGEATFRRPVERGCIVNWDAEREIWEHTFFDEKTARKELRVKDAGETTLVLTEAGNAMAALGRNVDEIVMEEWGFGAYGRCVGGYVRSMIERDGAERLINDADGTLRLQGRRSMRGMMCILSLVIQLRPRQTILFYPSNAF